MYSSLHDEESQSDRCTNSGRWNLNFAIMNDVSSGCFDPEDISCVIKKKSPKCKIGNEFSKIFLYNKASEMKERDK